MWVTRQHPFSCSQQYEHHFDSPQRAHLMFLSVTHGVGMAAATAWRCSPTAAGSGSPHTRTQQQPGLCPALPWRGFSICGKHPVLKQLFCLYQKRKQAINYMEMFHRMNPVRELQHRLQWLCKLGLLDNSRSKSFKSATNAQTSQQSEKPCITYTRQ